MQTIMPQIDSQIVKYVEGVKDSQDKDRLSRADALRLQTENLIQSKLADSLASIEAKIKDITDRMDSKQAGHEQYSAPEHL